MKRMITLVLTMALAIAAATAEKINIVVENNIKSKSNVGITIVLEDENGKMDWSTFGFVGYGDDKTRTFTVDTEKTYSIIYDYDISIGRCTQNGGIWRHFKFDEDHLIYDFNRLGCCNRKLTFNTDISEAFKKD